MAPFHGYDLTVSKVQSHYEQKVYFLTTKSPGDHVTHLINLGRMED